MRPDSPPRFHSSRVLVFVGDLAGYATACRGRTDVEVAEFLDRYYALADRVLSESGGRVVKFMGDAVLAVFPPDHAADAVRAAVALEVVVGRLASELDLPIAAGANLHLGPAVEASLGRGPGARPDVVGRTVNQAFLLGRGPGVRISEPVYRSLPSGERSGWTKNRPPAVYVLGEGGEPYEALRKSAAENALRW